MEKAFYKTSKKKEIASKPATVKKGIDVSAWQGDIDWAKVKNAGISHAIIRAGYTGQEAFTQNRDGCFSRNVKNAVASDIKCGVYYYSQAISLSEAKKEAEWLLNIIKPYKSLISLPVVFDWEFGGRLNSSVAKNLGKTKCTDIVEAFCDAIKAAGYIPMVYANYSTFNSYLDYTTLDKKYNIWLAQYASTKSIKTVDWWQYSSAGSVSGISGKVDVNKIYK